MKTISRIFVALLCAFMAFSCQKNIVPEPEPEPELPVTFYNTSGDWFLSSWNGIPMVDAIIEIHLKEKKFELTQNIGSMFPVTYTGSYNLLEVEGAGTKIRGQYDYTYEFWQHEYLIVSLTANTMTWQNMDDPEDIQVFVRSLRDGNE